jgi:hypothetical protein
MATTNGNCFICGKTAGKTAMKNHVAKEHGTSGNEHGDGDIEDCYLIKAEGKYDKDYWLLFSAPFDAPLSAVDRFLRRIWCECCGHMSAFRMGGYDFGKTRKLGELYIGDTLLYEYDFGTTTEITLKVVDVVLRVPQREKVQLLARNIPPQFACDRCGGPAVYVDAYEGDFLCDRCAEELSDDGMLLPMTNSPRSGECGYDGEQDIWTFDPKKPFPQPKKGKR